LAVVRELMESDQCTAIKAGGGKSRRAAKIEGKNQQEERAGANWDRGFLFMGWGAVSWGKEGMVGLAKSKRSRGLEGVLVKKSG